MSERHLEFDDHKVAGFVYGQRDENLKVLERVLGVRVSARGASAHVEGEEGDVRLAAGVLGQLYELVGQGHPVFAQDVERAIMVLRAGPDVKLSEIFLDTVFTSHRGRIISPKGVNQKRYVDAIRDSDVVFGVGPAGTGKTYLAMAMALSALTQGQCRRVILTRPAVEAGEKLGFLPGGLEDKVDPYLRPLYDAIYDMIDYERAQKMMEKGAIEVAPLAFMRGRTLSDAFVILDEAQNTTRAQMKMFLTRLGFDSKAVITGDITQVDLPRDKISGLRAALSILKGVKGIGICEFSALDVVRHPLVMRIIEAYEKDDKRRHEARNAALEEGVEPN